MKFAAVRRFDLQTGVDEELVAPDVYDVFWVGELGNRALLYATDMRRYGNVENPCFYSLETEGPICLADYDEGMRAMAPVRSMPPMKAGCTIL